jgi:hypothetical protein
VYSFVPYARLDSIDDCRHASMEFKRHFDRRRIPIDRSAH